MRYLIILLAIVFASCGVRKTEKTKQLEKNSLNTELSATTEASIVSNQLELKQVDYNVASSRQSFSDEHTELTADNIDYNLQTGALKATGNVKLKQKKKTAQSDSLSNKSKEVNTSQKAIEQKLKADKKEKTEQKSVVENTTKETKRNNTAATVFSVLVVVIGLMVFWYAKSSR